MNNPFLEKFFAIERNIAKEKGVTKLFALLQLTEAVAGWDVVISSRGLPDDGVDLKNLRFVVNKINEVLDEQETIQIPRVVLLDSDQPFFKELKHFLERNGNPREFGYCEINGMKIQHAHIIVSPVDDSKTFVTRAEVDKLQQQLNVLQTIVLQSLISQRYSQQQPINSMLPEQSHNLLSRKIGFLEGDFSTITDQHLLSIGFHPTTLSTLTMSNHQHDTQKQS
jgi:hypothetical protein